MVQIYYEIAIYIYKTFFLHGLRPQTPQGGQAPLATPLPTWRGVNYSGVYNIHGV